MGEIIYNYLINKVYKIDSEPQSIKTLFVVEDELEAHKIANALNSILTVGATYEHVVVAVEQVTWMKIVAKYGDEIDFNNFLANVKLDELLNSLQDIVEQLPSGSQQRRLIVQYIKQEVDNSIG